MLSMALEMAELFCSVVIVPISAGCIFLLTINLQEFSNSMINKLAGHVFGVYLLHAANPVNYLIWNHSLRIHETFALSSFLLWAIVSVIIVMLIGFLCDFIREKYLNEKIVHVIDGIKHFFVCSTIKDR